MARAHFTAAELEAWLEEALDPEEMAAMEQALRSDPALLQQLAIINARRDVGAHSVGAIWRRHRLSCPTREQLGSYLLGTLAAEHAGYLRFHLQTIGCRFCQANLADLQRTQDESGESARQRRSKFFHTSAGHLRGGRK